MSVGNLSEDDFLELFELLGLFELFADFDADFLSFVTIPPVNCFFPPLSRLSIPINFPSSSLFNIICPAHNVMDNIKHRALLLDFIMVIASLYYYGETDESGFQEIIGLISNSVCSSTML